MKIVFFCVFAFLLAVESNAKGFPAYLTLCHRKEPQLEECIKRAVEQLRPHLKEGIPELLIPPMEPLSLTQAGLDNGAGFNATFSNIELYGTSTFQIKHFKFDLDKTFVDLGVFFKNLRLKSQYTVNGKLLILQLQGKGAAQGNFTDISANVISGGTITMKKGRSYWNATIENIVLDLGKPIFQFDNIFGDNEELNQQTNRVINENIVDILDELKPILHKTVSEFTYGLISRILNRFSLEELFPN